MYIKEILQLNPSMASIKKIDLFLTGANKKSLEYVQAFCYRNQILHQLGKTSEALKALYGLVLEFPKMKDEEIICVCDAIIDITLLTGNFDETKKFIDEKKKHLKISNANLNRKDEIRYAIAKHDYTKAIEEIKKYLQEILKTEETCWAYECLADIYYELQDYPSFLSIVPELEQIYQDSLNTNKLIEIECKKLRIAYLEGNHIKVICDGNRLLNDYDLEDEEIIRIATLLIHSYTRSKDFRRASIIESNYEEKVKFVSDENALAFCKASLELYNQTNSLISIKHYQDLVMEFKQKIKQKTIQLPLKANVIIPKIKPLEKQVEIPSSAIPPSIHELTKNVQEVYVSKHYEKLEEVYKTINNLSDQVKFRELFRLALVELSKFISFDEAYLLYFDRNYLGLHYKKERAYDKRVSYEMLEDTVNFVSISQGQTIAIKYNSTLGKRNIVTGEPYLDIPYGIAIPFFKEGQAFASIAFFGKENFLEQDLNFETLKLVSYMLCRALDIEIKQNQTIASNKKMFFIYENMSSGIKELMEEQIHLSFQATQILGCLEDLTEKEYKSFIHPQDVSLYENVVEEVKKYLQPNQSVCYRFKKKGSYIEIKETFFPSFENGKISLYSLLEDNSKQVEKAQELYELAFINPLSKLETEVKLGLDLKEKIQHRKMSLCVLDVHDFKLYEELYGINFSNQLIYAIGQELKNYFKDNFLVHLYHLGYDRYAILLLDTNDKRSIDHLLEKAFSSIAKNLNLINRRIKLVFNCGVYRLSKSSTIEDPNKLLDYAYEALQDAKAIHTLTHHILHYDSDASKIRFNENQLITHISESIDYGRLGITYKQIVDIKNAIVYGYYAQISLDNYEIDQEYMQKVIERRDLEEMLDKYMISSCSKELKLLKENKNATIPIFIELKKATLQTNLVGFIETQNHFYKTTKHLIFYFPAGATSFFKELRDHGYKVASSNILDIIQKNIDYFIYDMQLGMESIKEIKNLCEQNHVLFILKNVSLKEDVLKATELGIDYVYGSYYKKSIRMKKVVDNVS